MPSSSDISVHLRAFEQVADRADGLLWYDAQTGQVSHTLPPPVFLQRASLNPAMHVSAAALSAVRRNE